MKHIKKEEERYLKQIFWGHIYPASSGSQTKGVMLGIRTKVPWQLGRGQLDEKKWPVYNLAGLLKSDGYYYSRDLCP